MDTISITDFRRTISDCVNRVAFGGNRLLLIRNNRPVAAVVPYEDFELLEEMYAEADRETFEAAAHEARTPLEAEPLDVEEAQEPATAEAAR